MNSTDEAALYSDMDSAEVGAEMIAPSNDLFQDREWIAADGEQLLLDNMAPRRASRTLQFLWRNANSNEREYLRRTPLVDRLRRITRSN